MTKQHLRKNMNNFNSQRNERWIFHDKNFWWRVIFIVLSSFCALFCYFYFSNICIGTFFLFLLVYLLGSSRGRNRIEIIENVNIESARVQIKKLINNAIKSVFIISGGLNPDIYNKKDVISSIINASNRGVEIYIVSYLAEIKKNYSRLDKKPEFLKKIIEMPIHLYDYKKSLKDVNHFIVVDRKSFRIEKIHGGSTKREAIIVYKNNKAEFLYNLSNKIIAKCIPIENRILEKIINPIPE